MSAGTAALVPPAVVTKTFSAPLAWAGETAVTWRIGHDREARGHQGSERHLGRSGEAGAGDGDGGTAGRRSRCRARSVTAGTGSL